MCWRLYVYLEVLYFVHLSSYGVGALLVLLLESLKLDLPLVCRFAVVLCLLLEFGPQLIENCLTLRFESMSVLQMLYIMQQLDISFCGEQDNVNVTHLVLEFVHHALKLVLSFSLPLSVAQLHCIEDVPQFLHLCLVLRYHCSPGWGHDL